MMFNLKMIQMMFDGIIDINRQSSVSDVWWESLRLLIFPSHLRHRSKWINIIVDEVLHLQRSTKIKNVPQNHHFNSLAHSPSFGRTIHPEKSKYLKKKNTKPNWKYEFTFHMNEAKWKTSHDTMSLLKNVCITHWIKDTVPA